MSEFDHYEFFHEQNVQGLINASQAEIACWCGKKS